MICLYSRKLQLVMLLCWFVGMTFMYVQITGERPLWLIKASKKIVEHSQEARLGQVELPAPVDLPAPVRALRPPADPELNRCLAMRVNTGTGEHANTLHVELDYVAAQTKGFTIEKARGYYLTGEPTDVVALGEPWTSDIGNASFTVAMPQATKLNLIVSKSRNLRLLVHTRSIPVALGAKFHISPTDTGIRLDIQMPR
jgi:hypothetical protein